MRGVAQMTTAKRQESYLAQHIMNANPVTVHETATIHEAIDKMAGDQVSALLIVDENNELKGVLSVNDLIRLVQSADQALDDRFPLYEDCYWVTELIRERLGTDEVTTAMSVCPITARQNDTLQVVAKKMVENKIHHVPITTHEQQLVGIVSSFDFVQLASAVD